MSDTIDRQAVMIRVREYMENPTYTRKMLMDELKNLPSAQPEIIHCKECVYSHVTYDGDCKYCDKWGEIYESGESLYLEGDFFCGFGERKTDD